MNRSTHPQLRRAGRVSLPQLLILVVLLLGLVALLLALLTFTPTDPSRTLAAISTAAPSASPTAALTPSSATPSSSPSVSPSPTSSGDPTALATHVPSAEPSAAQTESASPSPTQATASAAPEASSGPSRQATPRPTPTSTPRPAPISTPPPTPVATPTPALPAVNSYAAGHFSPYATVRTYPVSGRTPVEINASIIANGPSLAWTAQPAIAMVSQTPHLNVDLVTSGGTCEVRATATPAMYNTYEVLLPTWTPPPGTTAATVNWWNATLLDAVTHEHHHIDIFEQGVAAWLSGLPSWTCATAQAEIDRIAADTSRRQCEFDVAEYGAANGKTVEDCLAGS